MADTFGADVLEALAMLDDVDDDADESEQEVRFYVHFPCRETAQEAARTLEEEEFVCELVKVEDGWLCRAVHPLVKDEDTLTLWSGRIDEIADELGGEYERWDCGVELAALSPADDESLEPFALYIAGHYDDAIQAILDLLAAGSPKIALDWLPTLGLAYHKIGEFELAIEAFEAYLRLEHDDPECRVEAWNHLGDARMEMHDDFGAREAFERALAIDPHCGTAWYHLARWHVRQEQTDEALECLRRAVTCTPVIVETARADEGLAPLRESTRFQQVTAKA